VGRSRYTHICGVIWVPNVRAGTTWAAEVEVKDQIVAPPAQLISVRMGNAGLLATARRASPCSTKLGSRYTKENSSQQFRVKSPVLARRHLLRAIFAPMLAVPQHDGSRARTSALALLVDLR
jgi:hypothetical protein